MLVPVQEFQTISIVLDVFWNSDTGFAMNCNPISVFQHMFSDTLQELEESRTIFKWQKILIKFDNDGPDLWKKNMWKVLMFTTFSNKQF